jgi:Acetyltransferase (GNAT) domain
MSQITNRGFDAATDSGGAPANLYASPEFLDVVAKIYFPARDCRVEDFQLDGRVFRLLSVDGYPLTTDQAFLDMHEPLLFPQNHSRAKKLRRLASVSHGLVTVDEFKNNVVWRNFLGAPTVLWNAFGDWSDYLALLLDRGVLRDDRRRWRRLEELVGPLNFMANDLSEDVLSTCFSWKSARDRALKRTDLFARDQTRAFFRELHGRRLLQASTLRGDGQLLAIWLGAIFQGRWSGWVTAYKPDPSLAKFSLGRQMLYPMLEESYRAGHQEFDFSIGLESYKLFFATHARAVGSLGAPLIREQLLTLGKGLLRDHPLMYGKAKALWSRFSSSP